LLKIYPTYRFFIAALILCCIAFFIELYAALFLVLIFGAASLAALLAIEVLMLFANKTPFYVSRKVRSNLSLGDEETIEHTLRNNFAFKVRVLLRDNLPNTLQMRNFAIHTTMEAGQKKVFKTTIKPNVRGEYHFDYLDIFASVGFGFLQRRIGYNISFMSKVMPSVIQLKKYALANIKNSVLFYGVKKVRKIGHSYDFDHIKNYAMGDDIRSINWKATSRRKELMVNHYEDEKSQAVYCILDKSRSMNMPFNGLSLLDYSVNSTLIIANAALQHQDKAGLITFSDVLGNVMPAANSKAQLGLINETLYNQKHRTTDANYPLLYYSLRKLTGKRSLFFLFTNFESMHALDRQIGVITKIAKHHVLVVIVFKNTEIESKYRQKIKGKAAIYEQAVAEKYITEKQKIVKKIKSYGIRCIYTSPEDLNINTLNAYIQIKASGVI